nr:reverse transcriptase domain-containing protein [Tanacetum cinerariifolium]
MDEDVDVTLKDIAKDVAVNAKIKESADVLSMQDDKVEPVELQEVVEVVTTTKLITEVVTAASATITAAAPQLTIAAALTLTTAPSAARRRKGVVIRDLEETDTPSTIIHTEAKSKDKGKGILVEEPKSLKKQAQIKQDEAYTRELEVDLNKNIDWDETKEQIEEEDSRALKRISETQEEKAAKKKKLDEKVEEHKRHLQIVPNDEDDVYTEATPLARKVPVVDYEIYTKNNKPYYKIIRAEGSPQLFLSFLSLLRNFNQETWKCFGNCRKKISTHKVHSGSNAQQYKDLQESKEQQATNFGLKNDMIQQVHNSCQFHGLPGDDANKQLDKFLHVTKSIKMNGVTDDTLRLYIFPHSLTHHATTLFDRLPRNSINTFEQMAKMFLGKYFQSSMVTKLKNEITNFRQRPDESLFEEWERGTFMKRHLEECYDLIENINAHHNDWDTSAQQSELSISINSSFDTEIAALKTKMAEIKKNLMRVLPVNQQVKVVTLNCETCVGPHSLSNSPATVGNTQNVYAPGAYQVNSYQPQGNRNLLNYRSDIYLGPPASIHQPQIPQPQVFTTNEFINFMKANDAILKNMQTNMTSLTNLNLELKNMFGQFMKMNTTSSSGSRTLPGNTITNPKDDLKGITIRRGTAYPRPTIPPTFSSLVVEHETEVTKDTIHTTNNESTEDVQPLVVPTGSLILNFEPVISPIIEPVASPVSALRPNQRPSILYPARLQDQKLRDKANDQREKLFQIFKDLNFNISFFDALILMPKFGPSIKSLLPNKDKLCKLARTPLNEHCLAVLLKKLPEILGDPGKFLITCDFPGLAECLAMADLDASINLMTLSVWNNLSLPDLSPMCMTLELADRSISRLVGVAEDVFVKVGTFYFPANFVVVDFDVDPRAPLVLGRSFLKTGRALIDVFEGEL